MERSVRFVVVAHQGTQHAITVSSRIQLQNRVYVIG